MKLVRAVILVMLFSIGYASAQDDPKKVTQAEAMQAVVTKTAPDYPVIGRQLKIQGAVELEAVVAEDGTVEKVKVISGNPVLTKPAAEALKKWTFRPFTADGKAVKALAPVKMTFQL